LGDTGGTVLVAIEDVITQCTECGGVLTARRDAAPGVVADADYACASCGRAYRWSRDRRRLTLLVATLVPDVVPDLTPHDRALRQFAAAMQSRR
jgi:hypothetical protein